MQQLPLSLYFGVAKGDRASLDAIARASLEWSAAVHQIAELVAPGTEIRIEFDHSEDGSVWLRNLIKAARDGDSKALAAVAAGVLAFFAIGPALHLQADFGEKVLEILGHKHTSALSDADKDDIARRVVEALESTELGDHRQAIVREAESDPKITAVGVDSEPRADGPRIIIERHDFPAFGASIDIPAQPASNRRTKIVESADVIIVRPSLRSGEARPRWRFLQGKDEWSADIEDEEFVWALHEKQTGLLLAVGQHMIVDLAIDYKQIDMDVWQEYNRRVVRVIRPQVNRRQKSFV